MKIYLLYLSYVLLFLFMFHILFYFFSEPITIRNIFGHNLNIRINELGLQQFDPLLCQ